MKLKVYDKEGKSRELGPLSELTFEFDRNTFRARYRAGNGTMTHEDGELHTLFPEGTPPDFMFDSALGNVGDEVSLQRGARSNVKAASGVGHLVDPTSIPTAGLTGKLSSGEGQDNPRTAVDESKDSVKKTEDEDLKRIQERLRQINEAQEKPKEQLKSFSVPVESAVGHLVDPGSTDTGKLNKEGNLSIPNAPENKQGTTKMEINK